MLESFIPEMTIEEFADQRGLTMEIHERPLDVGDPARYYALFSNIDIKEGRFLVGAFGNGATPAEAIQNYAERISLRCLRFNGFGPEKERETILAPRLVAAKPSHSEVGHGSEP